MIRATYQGIEVEIIGTTTDYWGVKRAVIKAVKGEPFTQYSVTFGHRPTNIISVYPTALQNVIRSEDNE